jgi:hypothetical protein
MGFRKYPPAPKGARRLIWVARALAAAAFVVGLSMAMLAAREGETVLAMLFVAISVAYVLGTWANPLSPMLWIAIGTIVVVLLILDPGALTITLAIGTAVLFWLRGRKQSTPIDASTLRPVAPEAVMPGAEEYVGRLTDRGWRQAGAYEFDALTSAVIASVLVHPDLDRHAEITDMVFAIESRFEGSLILLTISSGRTRLPPNYLANDVLGASPDELADSHQRALDLLAGFGVTPLEVAEHTIVSEAMASEVETIEWSIRNPSGGLFNFGAGVGELDDSPDSRERIEAWLANATADR